MTSQPSQAEIREIAALFALNQGSDITVRQGVIADIGMGRVSVLLDGPFARGGIPFMSSYKPKIGDVVWLVKHGPDLFVWDRVQPGGIRSEPWRMIGDPGQPAYQNSWQNYGTDVTGTYRSVGFYKDVDGFVHMEGLAKNSSGAAYNSVMFTLPVGYRPEALRRISVDSAVASSLWAIDIHPNGEVKAMTSPNLDNADVKLHVSFSGIFFEADPGEDFFTAPDWVPLGSLWESWGWENDTANFGQNVDFPALWQRWDGLCRLRSLMGNGTGPRLARVPEDACRQRWAKILATQSRHALTTTHDNVISFLPMAQILFIAFWDSNFNRGIALDGLQWFSRVPESYWTPLALQNSWVRWTGDTVHYPVPSWYKDGYGFVHLRGQIASGTLTFDTTIAQLPDQARPNGRQTFKAWEHTAGIAGRIDVTSTGLIKTGGLSTNTGVSLDNIFFRASDS